MPRYTLLEDAYLRENNEDLDSVQLSVGVSQVVNIYRSEASVQKRLIRLRLRRNQCRKYVKWTAKEDAYLERLQGIMKLNEVVLLFNNEFGKTRTYSAIHTRLSGIQERLFPTVKEVAPDKAIRISNTPIALSGYKLIRAMENMDIGAKALSRQITRVTGYEMNQEACVLMMTGKGLPSKYFTPEIKKYLGL